MSNNTETTASKAIRVVIADDHNVVRAGLRGWLEHESDIVVLGEARDGEESLRMVRALKPDVLLQDLQLPGLAGIDVIRTLRQEESSTRVLAITGFDNRGARVALESGACGYLTKEERREIIVEAVRWAAAGSRGFWVSPVVAEGLTKADSEMERLQLTKAELNLLRYIESSNAEIAVTLGISESTVKNHITNIYSKLGLHNRREAVRWAQERGIIS